jgi:hypothetical protein
MASQESITTQWILSKRTNLGIPNEINAVRISRRGDDPGSLATVIAPAARLKPGAVGRH